MNIIGKKNLWFAISVTLILISLAAFMFNGLTKGKIMNFGIDFTGGSLLTLRFENTVSTHAIRNVLTEYGLAQSVIQKTGKQDFSIRTDPIEAHLRQKVVAELRNKFGVVELLEADVVGPVIGRELRTQALWTLLIASILITIYISFRFEFKFAMAALLALYHDAIITAGLIALLWRNVDIPFIAAILTIMGYSINDTIVIFDRIRENLKKPGAVKKRFATIVNESILQTLARSINTVLTTLIMVGALLLFGGATIKDFALVLLVGFLAGAYSSIFLASPLLVLWHKGKHK